MNNPMVRRMERQEMEDWRRQYRALLPKPAPPERTPDCTCDWVDDRGLTDPEPVWYHVRYDDDCPAHTKPEEAP